MNQKGIVEIIYDVIGRYKLRPLGSKFASHEECMSMCFQELRKNGYDADNYVQLIIKEVKERVNIRY